MGKYFKDLEFTTWSGKTVIVDIDGTITTDGSSDIDPLVFKKMQELSLNNSVFLFSNKKLIERNNELANKLQIQFLHTSFKKPSRGVINRLPEYLKKNLVVIGDKVLIDGMFAKNIKAEFVKVKRLVSQNDSFKTKLIYIMDNIIGFFIKKE